MRSLDYSQLISYISSVRLQTYKTFFSTNSDDELLGCYLWNKDVAAAFFPLLQVLEITLRNSIDKEAKSAFGNNWFDNLAHRPTTRFSKRMLKDQQRQIRIHDNAIMSARKSLRYELKLPSSVPVPQDRIIAKLSFGVWTNLFNAPFDVNRNNQAIWPKLIRKVFPNAPQGYRDRQTLQQSLLLIKDFRNKAFHHEPVWNIGRPASLTLALVNLESTKDTIIQLIRWMSLDAEQFVLQSGYLENISRVCSVENINYLKNPKQHQLPVSQIKRELTSILKQRHKTTDIISNGKRLSKIINL